jgi:hypothetical protein
LTSACDDCGDLRDNIQQVIDLAAGLRARALHNTCTPDGIVGSSEQCDPLAQPSGCPVLTLPSFCNDDCECQVVPTEPVPCDLPFPATCDDACQCQPISAGAP